MGENSGYLWKYGTNGKSKEGALCFVGNILHLLCLELSGGYSDVCVYVCVCVDRVVILRFMHCALYCIYLIPGDKCLKE